MDPTMIAILITGVLNLIATLKQSRCTEIDSECGCFKFHVEREIQETENNIV